MEMEDVADVQFETFQNSQWNMTYVFLKYIVLTFQQLSADRISHHEFLSLTFDGPVDILLNH